MAAERIVCKLMIFSVEINNRIYKFDANAPLDISIPLNFNGEQPNAFGVETATSKPYETENLIGDTRRGGSCNFEQVKFIPHCNGTHTECVGHITDERISIQDCLKTAFVLATLISIQPETANKTSEIYAVELTETDKLLTRKSIETAMQNLENPKSEGLIIRTLPNDESKKSRAYAENLPPFFSTEAINYIAKKGVKHLLVDMPSIDRAFDKGKLSNHRIFWNVEPESRALTKESLSGNTITEMIYVAEEIQDGAYLLNLQIAAFAAEASPSRPLLFKFFE
jgi:arylformamidase